MPNKLPRNKKARAGFASRTSGPRGRVDSVKDVLARLTPTLTAITSQAARQSRWRAWLEEHLAADLMLRVTGVVERGAQLVIFTESASWGVRLRYSAAELESQLHALAPHIERIVVRVLPRSG
jgi:hypothetical protein